MTWLFAMFLHPTRLNLQLGPKRVRAKSPVPGNRIVDWKNCALDVPTPKTE
jgi:hypothetical protein